jgi:hypothetical protein
VAIPRTGQGCGSKHIASLGTHCVSHAGAVAADARRGSRIRISLGITMSDNSGFWRAYNYETTQVGPVDAVAPPVLAQALGSQLGPGEDVTCARFVRFTGGRLLGSTGGGSHVVIVTDRRVMRVTAQEVLLESDDHARSKWPAGVPIKGGALYRYEIWLGQLRDVERRWYWGKDRWLALCTFDGREQGVAGRAEAIVALETAIRQALEGPGRWTHPPPPPPDPVRGWAERWGAIVRPNGKTRG